MHLARSLILVSSLAACTASAHPAHPAAPEPPPTPNCVNDAGAAAPTMLHGVVTDQGSGGPLSGVTVIATSPAMPNGQVAITDEAGAYKVALTAGTYLVSFYFMDFTIERTDVPVRAGCDTPVFQRIDTAAASKGELIQI